MIRFDQADPSTVDTTPFGRPHVIKPYSPPKDYTPIWTSGFNKHDLLYTLAFYQKKHSDR